MKWLRRNSTLNERDVMPLERIPGPDEWRCHVCGDVRPDAYIGVRKLPLPGMEDLFPATRQNVRYCLDRSECIEGSKEGLIKS